MNANEFFSNPEVTPRSCRLGGIHEEDFYRLGGVSAVQKYSNWSDADKYQFGVVVQIGNEKVAHFSKLEAKES